MKQTKALRRMLEDMTAVYSGENRKVPVQFTTGTPHASQDGRGCDCDTYEEHVAVCTNVRDTYGKNLDGANELRVLADTLNHEMEHVRSSPLTAKREFSARYPDCPDFAGLVLNVLEDQYIDWQRLKRFRGLRSAHSFKVDAIMSNGSRRPPLYNLEQSEQVAEGFLQMAFSGYVKGFSDAERPVQEAIVKCRPLVDLVRNEHDPLEREGIAHTCMSILLEAVPDPEQADEYTDENQEQMPTDEPADVDPEDIQDMLDDLEPEDLEGEQPEDGPSVAIDPEEYDVPEWLEDEMEQADGSEQEVSSQPEQEDDPWADEDAQGGDEQEQEQGDEQQEGEDSEGEQGEGDGPEQEQPGEDGQQEGDTSSEGEQQDSQEGGDSTEGSTGQQGDQGEQQPEGSSQPQGQEDDPYSTAGGDGERSEDTTAGGADPVEQGIQEMEKKERERNAGDHWEAGDTDYQAPDDEFQRRYQRIEQEVQQEQTDLGQQKRRRENRIENADERNHRDGAERVRELLRSDGTAEDIVEAFKKFKTQDRWLPDTRGERLNTRNATRRLAGDYSEDRVYDRKLKAEVGDRVVGVAMDLSNSMNGVNNLRLPKKALGALHLATKTIGDDLLATGYKTLDNHPQKGKYEPVLDLITGPSEGFDWEHLDAAKAGMYTPTADGVMYTLDLLKKSHRREKVMVVITDGKANIPLGGSGSTSSSRGREDAKRAVNTARQEGVKVLGMAVGRVGDEYMDDVFGPQKWVHTESSTLTEDLVELYRGQMRTGNQRPA